MFAFVQDIRCLWFALGANIPFLFTFPYFIFSVVWSQRVESFENGVSQNPPGHTGSKLFSLCWLVRGFWYKIRSLLLLFFFPLLAIFWSWEKDDNFDSLIYNADICAGAIQWVDIKGNPVSVSREWTGNGRLGQRACLVEKGEVIGHVYELRSRDPDHFGSKIHPMYIIRRAS